MLLEGRIVRGFLEGSPERPTGVGRDLSGRTRNRRRRVGSRCGVRRLGVSPHLALAGHLWHVEQLVSF
jgi:hypothetical protein